MTKAKSVQLAARTCVLWQFLSAVAVAEGDNAAAQLLFEQGRDLLKSGNVEQACPKLEESVRLEVATGALLALAMCHEQAGKLATAWAEYETVATRAEREGHAEREQWARERVAALRPLLSTLNIQISEELARLPGLQVWRNEQLLGAESWNIAVPVDGGSHRLKVTATGREPWEMTLEVKQHGELQLVEVPVLASSKVNDGLAPRPGPTRGFHSTSLAASHADSSPRVEWGPNRPDAEPSSLSNAQLWGVGLVAVSLASFATSGVMLYRATTLSGKSDSALAWGNGATYFAVGGGALAAVGGALLIWGGNGEATAPAAKLRLEVSPRAMAVGFTTPF